MTVKPKIILIDDEKSFRKIFANCLKSERQQDLIEVETARTAREGLELIRKNQAQKIPMSIWIDIILPDISGEELVPKIDFQPSPTEGILISAHKTLAELEEIREKHKGLSTCLCKPLKRQNIKDIVRNFLDFLNQSALSRLQYEEFDEETTSILMEETAKIKSILKKTAENIIDIGGSLHKIKSKLDHGQFQLWIERELLLDHSTAANFMRVWDTFGHRKEEIAELGLGISILYLMASRNTPEEFREEVFRRARMGNPPAVSEAKQLRKEFLSRSEIQQQQSDTQDSKIKGKITTTIDISSSPELESTSQPENTVTQISPEPNTQPPNKTKPSKIIKAKPQEIIKVVREQKVWELGDHILYCGLSNAPDFKDLLKSSTISLNIGFPNFSNWTQEVLFPVPARSTLVYNTLIPFTDPTRDPLSFFSMVQNSMEFSTEEQNQIVISFSPYPEIILLIEKLSCKAFIAEPDPQKCQAIISLWKQYEVDRSFPF